MCSKKKQPQKGTFLSNMERWGVEQMDKVVGKITNHPCPVGTGDKELFFFSVRS
jgi:hypothetical protein